MSLYIKIIFYLLFLGLYFTKPFEAIVLLSALSFILIQYATRKAHISELWLVRIASLTLQISSLTVYLYQFEGDITSILFMIFVYEILMIYPNAFGMCFSLLGYLVYLWLWYGLSLSYLQYLIQTITFLFFLIAVVSSKNLAIKNKIITELNEKITKQNQQIEASAKLMARNKLAEEMHDTIGHTLTASIVSLDGVAQLIEKNPEEALRLLSKSKTLLKESLSDVRQTVRNLKDQSDLSDQDLNIRLMALVKHVTTTSHLSIDMRYTLKNVPTALHDYVIYNTVQEALTNILRHSNANHVTVDVHEENATIDVTIHDNGTGEKSFPYGFGLNTMQQRMLALGGTLHTEIRPKQGFTVQGKLPVFYDLEVSDE